MLPGDGLNIIHGDLDAFYATVEQRDNPVLRGKPVIVGGDPDSRGVVATCSYEARRYGVKSAMPLAQALRLCPDGVFLPVNMKLYRQASRQVMAIMASYSPLFEPLSIDEAFLDVSGCEALFGSADKIAREIKQRVYQENGLTISMGVSYNKFLAKLATELGKPDGFYVIDRENMFDLLTTLPVSYIWGVGSKTMRILEKLDIRTIGDLRDTPHHILEKKLGSSAALFLNLAQGIDDRKVEPDRARKSMGKEITFDQDVNDPEYLGTVILDFAGQLARHLRRLNLQARTVTVKVKYQNFQTITRTKALPEPTNAELAFNQAAQELLSRLNLTNVQVRLVGLSLGNLCPKDAFEQGLLFDQPARLENQQLEQALDQIRDRFGEKIITRASLLENK